MIKILNTIRSSAYITILFATLLPILNCSKENISGNTNEVVNPGITITLNDSSNTKVFSGRIKGYYSNQNPLLDSIPIFEIPFSNQKHIRIDTTLLNKKILVNQSRMKSIRNSKNWGSNNFNLVIETNAIKSGMYTGLRFDNLTKQFYYQNDLVDSLKLNVFTMVLFKGTINYTPENGLPIMAFIPGSPYYTEINNDSFSFVNIPSNFQSIQILTDSFSIYNLNETILIDTTSSYTLKDKLGSHLPSEFTLPLRITVHPQDKRAYIGESITFTVSAIGSGPLAYQWRKNNELYDAGNSDSLMLTNLSPSDSNSTFDVIVSDTLNSDTSVAVFLSVHQELQLLTPLVDTFFLDEMPVSISWSIDSLSNITSVNIYLSLDGGMEWMPFNDKNPILISDPEWGRLDTLLSRATTPPSVTAKIKVENSLNPLTFDVSDSVFVLQ